MIELTGSFDDEIDHTLLGKIAKGTISIEHYWMDRWYSVFRFSEPTGELRNFYCNVNAPPSFDGRVLSYVDMDIDILVAPDLTYDILDKEEFAENTLRYGYPLEVQRCVHSAVVELIELIENRQFPFVECI